MLRLELKDNAETVMFIDPVKGVKIHKAKTEKSYYELCVETSSTICYAIYNTAEYRDIAYDYVLDKINEYLFPQIEFRPHYVGEE